MGLKIDVRLQRLSDYPVLLSTVKHGDCPSDGQIRENVGVDVGVDVGVEVLNYRGFTVVWMDSPWIG